MYVRAAQELIDGANSLLSSINLQHVELEVVTRQSVPPENEKLERLIPAYSAALLMQARKNKRIVALDADLILDTGLIPFQKEFPERFIECGIAEQDMVSQAGGMALEGLLPIVHSFSCFLSSRPNEQIYNNATEKKKIIYVGSLAGVLPAGPGHSHQAVRDISSLSAIPGLIIAEPSCEREVGLLLDWAVNRTVLSSYLRLVSIHCGASCRIPDTYFPEIGVGLTVAEGTEIMIVAYGPLLIETAFKVASMLAEEDNIKVKILNMPWLNFIDPQRFIYELKNIGKVICLDNHYSVGGQGDRLAAIIAEYSPEIIFHKVGIKSIPKCGGNDDVLIDCEIDAHSILNSIRTIN